MKERNLKVDPKKCLQFQKEEEFLRHTVSANVIKTTGAKINAIRDLLKDKHEVRKPLFSWVWQPSKD